MKMLRTLALLARARRGNVSVIFALSAPLLIASAAFGVETSYWYYKQHQLQGAADTAAFAASLEHRNGSGTSVINAAALDVAEKNGFDPSLGTLTVNTPPTTGAYAGNSAATTVTLTQTAQRFFTEIFSSAPVVITSSATSLYQSSSDACILALSPSASSAVYVSGSASLTLGGCVVMSDSVSQTAVTFWGASTVTTSCVLSSGGVQNKGGLTETACSAPVTNASPAPDPFKNLPAPSTSGSCASSSGKTLSAGVYCGGLDLKGNVTLNPGVYVINGGTFNVNANANITGAGVTIYLTGGATVSMNGNATVNLSAPTSGTYSGILFFGDRNYSGLTNSFNGTASSSMTGALYFPSDSVSYNGNFAGASGCTQIVADTVSWSGNTSFNVSCSSYGMSPIPALQAVKLVG